MYVRIVYIFFIFYLLLIGSSCQTSSDTKHVIEYSREKSQEDLDFILKTLKENHPGSLDEKNPYFAKIMLEGYRIAQKELVQAPSALARKKALSKYILAFQDGHLSLNWHKKDLTVLWPKFTVSMQGSSFIVDFVDKETLDVKLGDELLSCDSQKPTKILEKTVFPYTDMKGLKASYIQRAPDVLNGTYQQFKVCKFQRDSKVYIKNLVYSSLSNKEFMNLTNRGFYQGEFVIKSYDNVLWISLPTFHFPNKLTKAEELERILVEIPKQISGKDFVVFDVRGNGGGNSNWGDLILKSVYGEDFPEKNKTKEEVFWRVSRSNLKYLKEILPSLLKRFGANADISIIFSKVAQDMEQALVSGINFIQQPDEKSIESIKIKNSKRSHLIKAPRAILLTDTACGSACLDFADKILQLPKALHLGLPTSADTVYMDIRSIQLPSSEATLNFAMKVYRNRKRGHNKAYEPQKTYDDDIRQTDFVRKWVLNTIKDL